MHGYGVLYVRTALTQALLTAGAVLWAHDAYASGYKDTPEYVAIADEFRITSEVKGDFNDDASEDVAIAYRTSGSGSPEGGLLILRQVGGAFRPAYHVFFDSTYVTQVRGGGGGLELTLMRSSPSGDEERVLQWKHGKDYVYNNDERSFLGGVRVSSSSNLRGTTRASNVVDDDLDSAWAEGVGGTGVGESITVKLRKPIGVGMIGVFPGKSTNEREFKRANRVHRATLEIQTESDIGDEASALDFSDLGIDIGGDTEELSFDNRPAIKFFKVKRNKALNFEFKIDSVYLGDKEDDTYISEVQIVPLLPRAETLDKAKKTKGARPTVRGQLISED